MSRRASRRKFPKIRWTPEEDELLFQSIQRNGTNNWTLVAESLPFRTGKQCRERWINQLNPDLNVDQWTTEEDNRLLTLAKIHGHRWAVISSFLNGRSVTSTKNRYGFLQRHQGEMIRRLDFAPDRRTFEYEPPSAPRETSKEPGSKKVMLPSIDLLPNGPIAGRSFYAGLFPY
jgi:hypothetical protein